MLPRLLRSARVAVRPAAPFRVAQIAPRVPLALRAYSALPKLKDEDDSFVGTPAGNDAAQSKITEAARNLQQSQPKPAENGVTADDFFTPDVAAAAEAAETRPSGQAADKPAAAQTQIETAETADPAEEDTSKFASLKGKIDADLLKALTGRPFRLTDMTEVQQRVLSKLPGLVTTNREDLLVKAKTGTGKTIAFLSPAISARDAQLEKAVAAANPRDKAKAGLVRREERTKQLGALVISPTRELASQIAEEAAKLQTHNKDRQVQLLVGGRGRIEQLKRWKSIRNGRKDVVVATPGRLRDLLSEPEVRDAVATTDILVLDEADTLLDMGFSDDLKYIVDHLPPREQRQTFLFSATVSREVRDIARDFLKDKHDFIDCVPKNESNVHAHIPQHVTIVEPQQQLAHVAHLLLQDQLEHGPKSKVILFLNTTKQTMLYATLLKQISQALPRGVRVHEIHSRLTQTARERSADRFKNDKYPSVLVTSDVSARGVDYPGVTRVIQVGAPSSEDQYVHRVGRTGRGGKTGGRGDLVLLPFEAGFTGSLERLKVPFTVLPFAEQAEAAAAADRMGEEEGAAALAKVDEATAGLPDLLDPKAVGEVYMSLLGFYASKTSVLGRVKPDYIYEGLNDWATKAMGLPQPPYLSHDMRMRFGLGGNKRNNDRGDRRGSRQSFGVRSDRGDRGERSFGGRGDRGDRGDRYGGDRGDRDFSRRRDREDRFSDRADRGDRGDRFTRPRRNFDDDLFEDRPRRSSFRGDRPRY